MTAARRGLAGAIAAAGTLALGAALAACGGSSQPTAPTPSSSPPPAASSAVPAAQGPAGTPGCIQFGLVNSQITAAVPPGESAVELDAALISQGAAWGKSLSAAGAAAESGPQAGATAASDIDLASLYVEDAVLAADLGKDAAAGPEWTMAVAALAKAAKDCAG